jgi:hypothetical protein
MLVPLDHICKDSSLASLHYLVDVGDDTDAISGVIKTFTAKRTRSVREALITTYA